MSKPITPPFVHGVTPFLWFEKGAQDAAKAYTALFADSRIVESNPQSATIVLAGQQYILFNGGPHYAQTPAFSLMVQVETQEELDAVWDALLAGGKASRCGWLVDRFGLSWQIVPTILPRLLGDPDRAKGKRALDAMLGMVKLDIAELTRAHAG